MKGCLLSCDSRRRGNIYGSPFPVCLKYEISLLPEDALGRLDIRAFETQLHRGTSTMRAGQICLSLGILLSGACAVDFNNPLPSINRQVTALVDPLLKAPAQVQ